LKFFIFYFLQTKCTQTRPPGCLIYKQNDVNIFEVLGWKAQTYCEDLCLIATLFIESKVEIKNVHRFRFYVLTVCHDNNQYHFAGFFSKLQFQERLNLSCLLILPPYRNRGFGSLMIHISKLRFSFFFCFIYL
jgi:histone acetyltransferase SAS3